VSTSNGILISLIKKAYRKYVTISKKNAKNKSGKITSQKIYWSERNKTQKNVE
jgi:hypothetical protein